MITAFELNHGRLQQVTVESLEDLQHCHPVWVDFESPTEEEREWAKSHFSIDLPEEDEVDDIEASARFANGVAARKAGMAGSSDIDALAAFRIHRSR